MTAILDPRPLRLRPASHGPRRRLHGLGRALLAWEAWLRAEAVLVSPPGSGRTWLAAMVSRYYHLTAGAPGDRLIKQRGFYRTGSAPRFYLGHPSRTWGDRDAAAVVRLHGRRRSIFLVRDPRDAAVSQLFHELYRSAGTLGLAAVAADGRLTGAAAERLDKRLRGALRSLQRIQDVADRLPSCLIVSYEGILDDPRAALGHVLGFAHAPPDAAALAAAVEFCSFARMQAREAAGGGTTGAMRAGDAGNRLSFKTRQGGSGGYQHYLEASARLAVDRLYESSMPPALRRVVDARRPAVRWRGGEVPT